MNIKDIIEAHEKAGDLRGPRKERRGAGSPNKIPVYRGVDRRAKSDKSDQWTHSDGSPRRSIAGDVNEAFQTNLQKMIAKKRKAASKGNQQCEWFAGCKNPATGSTPHPVFPNGVPTCDRCHKFATGEVRKINENDDRQAYHDLNHMQSQAAQEPDPYVITQGVPRSWGTWRPKDAKGAPIQGTFITLKTTEPRGGPMEVIRSMAYQSTGTSGKTVGPFRQIGITGVFILSGHDVEKAIKKAGWGSFKPAGLTFAFAPSMDGPTAELAFENLLSAFRSKQEKSAKQREKHRAEAPARAKAAAAGRRGEDASKRQALYDKYGKKNVLSVTAKQIGGDDGYQWNVLINGHSMVSGLTHSEVPHYKKQAYEILLKRNGKQ